MAAKGFCCFDASDWHTLPLTQETIIMGPNNSGKSAILSIVDFFRDYYWEFPQGSFSWNSEAHSWQNTARILHPSLAGYHAPMLYVKLGFSKPVECSFTARLPELRVDVSPSIRVDEAFEIQKKIRQIWHFHPIRPGIPSRTEVRKAGIKHQPLSPSGLDAVQFLLEKYTSRDDRWDEAERWLKMIDPDMDILTVPLRATTASIETLRRYGDEVSANVNIAYQGTGMQSICSVVAGLVFSDEGSTIIIEEPEAYLHPRSQETVVDLMNTAVNEWGKQVIATTHSWDIVLPFVSDIGEGKKRGAGHVIADPGKFSLIWIDDQHKIQKYELAGKKYTMVRDDAKELWG